MAFPPKKDAEKTDDKDKKGNPFAKKSDDGAKDDKKPNPFAKKDDDGDGDKDTGAKKSPFAKKDNPIKANATPGDKAIKAPAKEKVENPQIKDKVKVDFEPTMNNEQLEFIFEGDLSDQGEYADIIAETLAEFAVIGEDLSIVARLRKKAVLRRSQAKVQIGRRRSMRRRATTDRIHSRARKSAIEMLKTKFAGNRNPQDLGFAEKSRVERMVHRRKKQVERIARKLFRTKRAAESERLKS